MDDLDGRPIAEAAIVRVDLIDIVLHVPRTVLVVHKTVQARGTIVETALNEQTFALNGTTAVAADGSRRYTAQPASSFYKVDITHP